MIRIPAYSSQAGHGDKPLCWLNLFEALEAVRLGSAFEIKGGAIQFRDLQRNERPSNSGIAAHEMRSNAADAHLARAKVKEWGRLQRANFQSLTVHA